MNQQFHSNYLQMDISEWDLFNNHHTDILANLFVSPPSIAEGVCFSVTSGCILGKVYKLYVPFPLAHDMHVMPDIVYMKVLQAMTDMVDQMNNHHGLVH